MSFYETWLNQQSKTWRAAGAVAVSKTIKLTRGLSNSFSQPVEVTIPYDASTVGADDYPVVFYPG